VKHSDDELGTVRRMLLILLGLWLTGDGFDHARPIGWLVGCLGLFLLLGASGLIELAMAIYYRLRHRATQRA